MAGLWTRWEPETRLIGLDAFGGGEAVPPDEANDGRLESFTIVTTEPNEVVADLHHRMAAILRTEAERQWIEADDPRHVLEPHPADDLRAYPVSRAVTDPANDDPSPRAERTGDRLSDRDRGEGASVKEHINTPLSVSVAFDSTPD